MSPTQRSLAHLRQAGYLTAVVERWNPYANIRQDLFGFADIIAVKDGVTLAVQTTSAGNVAARLSKLAGITAVGQCIKAGWRVEVHGWGKRKVKRGGKAYRYELRTVPITKTGDSDNETT